jgi:hypothetical protein
MSLLNSVAGRIDLENLQFTSNVKARLSTLGRFSACSLEWLMVEHYQFSKRNTEFLAQAAETALQLATPAVALELRRNLAEESGHARMYRRALLEIGVDTELRAPFAPTATFFDALSALVAPEPSTMLGAMYATETAAIFEHEVFRDISEEVMARKDIVWEGARLKYFHDMHLSGVEQSHKDELGIFLTMPQGAPTRAAAGEVNGDLAYQGATRAIQAMRWWWSALLDQIKEPVAA